MIEAENRQLYNIPQTTIPLTNNDFKHRLSLIIQSLTTIERIRFTGGEPLLIKEHYKLLDLLIQFEKFNVTILYNTNLTLLTYKRNNNIVDYWNQFADITLQLSIDASYERAEYLRKGTIWKDIVQNYDIIRKECPHVKMTLASVISIYNAFNVIDLHTEWLLTEKVSVDALTIRPVIVPEYMTLQVLPMIYKKLLSAKINKHIELLSQYSNSHKVVEQWNKVHNFMYESDHSHKLRQFFTHCDRLDTFRGEKFETVFTEYEKLRSHGI